MVPFDTRHSVVAGAVPAGAKVRPFHVAGVVPPPCVGVTGRPLVVGPRPTGVETAQVVAGEGPSAPEVTVGPVAPLHPVVGVVAGAPASLPRRRVRLLALARPPPMPNGDVAALVEVTNDRDVPPPVPRTAVAGLDIPTRRPVPTLPILGLLAAVRAAAVAPKAQAVGTPRVALVQGLPPVAVAPDVDAGRSGVPLQTTVAGETPVAPDADIPGRDRRPRVH